MINSNRYKSLEDATNSPYKTLQLISDIAIGCDGFNEEKDLKKLINELKYYADYCLTKARKKGKIK